MKEFTLSSKIVKMNYEMTHAVHVLLLTSGKTQFGNYLELGHITRNSGKSGINQG